MKFDAVKLNIDKKVDKMFRQGKTVDKVIQQIESLKESFILLLGNDAMLAPKSERDKLMKIYIEYSDTKLNDMVVLNDYVKQIKN